MADNTRVSVVVPVYNVEKYLDRCVSSIVNQTYRDLEIILVDDGSPDHCPQMCEEWAKKDARIKVIHKENAGLGMARNTGIENAAGDYICFFDSDDYIHPETIAHSVALAESEQAQIVCFGNHTVNRQGAVIRSFVPESEKICYRGDEVLEEVLPSMLSPSMKKPKTKNIVPSACFCLFSTELIRQTNWRFVSEREIISEDIYSLLDLFRNVDSVAVLKEALYYYCENEASLTRVFRPERFERNKQFYQKCVELCERYSYPSIVVKSCRNPFLGNTIGTMKIAVKHYTAMHDAVQIIRTIAEDSMMQAAIRSDLEDSEKFSVRVLFWLMLKKQYFLCYILLRIKSSK